MIASHAPLLACLQQKRIRTNQDYVAKAELHRRLPRAKGRKTAIAKLVLHLLAITMPCIALVHMQATSKDARRQHHSRYACNAQVSRAAVRSCSSLNLMDLQSIQDANVAERVEDKFARKTTGSLACQARCGSVGPQCLQHKLGRDLISPLHQFALLAHASNPRAHRQAVQSGASRGDDPKRTPRRASGHAIDAGRPSVREQIRTERRYIRDTVRGGED